MQKRRPKPDTGRSSYYVRVRRAERRTAPNLSIWLIGGVAMIAVIGSVSLISKSNSPSGKLPEERPAQPVSTPEPARRSDGPALRALRIDSAEGAAAYRRGHELLKEARTSSGQLDQAKLKEADAFFEQALFHYRKLAEKHPDNDFLNDRLSRINRFRYDIQKSSVVR